MKNLAYRMFFSLFASFALAAQAQANADLYDAVAPANSAFLRVLNLTGTGADVKVTGKTATQKVTAGQIGGYMFTPAGKTKISVNSVSGEYDLVADTATTFVFDGKALIKLDDKYVNDPRKALVSFYNLSDKKVALKTADGKHALVDELGKNETGNRLVNEIKITLAAYSGDSKVVGFDEQFLKKGRSYSYVLIEQGGKLRTIAVPNAVDPIL